MAFDLIVFEGPDNYPNGGPAAIADRIDLEGGVFVECMDQDLMRTVKRACFFRGYNFDMTDHTRELYAFAKELPQADRHWDEEGRLAEAIALSRLCHPTSIALEYSGTVTFGAAGQIHQVVPALHQGHGAQAFVADATIRNWLVPNDIIDLPAMMRAFRALPRPTSRIAKAIWFYEYAARTEHVPVRWTLAATAIEALCHVERYSSTRQFVVGVLGIANHLGVAWTEAEATSVYSDRSAYAHGATLQNTAAPRLLIQLEDLVRAATRRALLDPAFAALFGDVPVAVEN